MDHHEENEKMGRLSSLGETYKREEVAQAAEEAKGRSELDALIAYLQVLGTALRGAK